MTTHRKSIDQILRCENRTFRTMPGKLMLGSTGKRLWVDYFDPVAGFQGRIDFIHKVNIPLIFSVRPVKNADGRRIVSSTWYPSHLHMSVTENDFILEEDKFITADDIMVSIQSWKNVGEGEGRLELLLPDNAKRENDGTITAAFYAPNHDFHLSLSIKSSIAFEKNKELCILPGEKKTIMLCAGIRESSEPAAFAQNISEMLKNSEKCLSDHVTQYDQWYEDVPAFSSDDDLLNKTWWYRWFLLRHNYAEPNYGLMYHGVFYEGRSHKVDKSPMTSKGHEFSQMIPLSTPMHLCDCRWKQGNHECMETLYSLLDSIDNQGFFATMMVDRRGAHYGNYAQWAFYQFILVHPNPSLVRELLPEFKMNFRTVQEAQQVGTDILPVCFDHRRTGKEYQPSFWYFTDFPDNVRNKESFTPLKRVDLAAYQYRNAIGLAKLCRMIGDPDAAEFEQTAETLRHLMLDKMWDDDDGFFYDLHYQTEAKARVKNVTGADPLWACVTDGKKYLRALDTILSDEFATGDCFASTSRNGSIFMPQGGWKNDFFKGRNGCMWNGPSWPFTTAIVLDMIADQSKKNEHCYDAAFAKYLRQYSLEHFKEQNLSMPYLVEHYDSVTGEALSDEVDYLHSYYIDLIVRHVGGIEPNENGITFDPIDIGLKEFTMDGLNVAGHEIGVSFVRKKGYTVTMDGKRIVQNHLQGSCTILFESRK